MSAAWPGAARRSASPRSPARRRSPGARAARRTPPRRSCPCRSSRAGPGSSRSASLESLACTSCSRPGADRRHQRVQGRRHAARRGQVVPGRPGVAGVEADAQPRVAVDRGQVRRRGPRPATPGCGRRPRSARPAAGRPARVGARSSSGSSASRTWCSALSACAGVDRAAGVEDHRRARRSPRPGAARAPASRPTARPSRRSASRG